MAEAYPSRQRFRKFALVIAYAAVSAFGAAVMLVFEHRPLDERGQMMIAIIGIGAFLGAIATMLFAKKLMKLSRLPRFIAVFIVLMLATLTLQGALAGAEFNVTSVSVRDSIATYEGTLGAFSISAHGFVYYIVYGSNLALPVGLVAALLFSLGFLTLRSQSDKT